MPKPWSFVPMLLVQSFAMRSRGTSTIPPNATIFLTKFCISYNPPQRQVADNESHSAQFSHREAAVLEASIKLPSVNWNQEMYLLLLDDEADSYPGPSGDWDSLSCAERRKKAKNSWPVVHGGLRMKTMVREKIRPRWWYVALADCSGQGFAGVEYEVHALNILYGWASEFSTDRRFAFPVHLLLCVGFAMLIAIQMRANLLLTARQNEDSASNKAVHPFARILVFGIGVELVACVLEVLHLSIFAGNGFGSPVLHVSSLLASTCSNFVLVSLLLLVSQGKCVSYRMLPRDAWRMFLLLGPFLISCLLLELWGDFASSRTYSSDYVYNTPFGWAVIAVDLGLGASYLYNVRTTLSHESGQADSCFYCGWGVTYGCWFLALPFSAALSKILLAPYVWYIVSLAITKGSNIFIYGALVFALWPENRRTHFKRIRDSPEELLEQCPSPRSTAKDSHIFDGAKHWISSKDLPNLLSKKLFPQAGIPFYSKSRHDA
mmetsp:Transcript_60731/g.113514  ORF Transcript_60731/g.113514 Transcript_60731/m.113514 type:complete len:491 (+) Transcript_60731:47-1519(+)